MQPRSSSRSGSWAESSMLPATSGMASGVFMPPARVKPSATPLGEPASRLSKLIGRRKGGAKYQSASESSKSACSTSRNCPALERGRSELRRPGRPGRPVPRRESGAVGRGAEPGGEAVEGREGGPATGTFNLLGTLAAWCPPALVDMLEPDLGRGSKKRPGAIFRAVSTDKVLGTVCSPHRDYHARRRLSKAQIGCGLPAARLQGKSWWLTHGRPWPALTGRGNRRFMDSHELQQLLTAVAAGRTVGGRRRAADSSTQPYVDTGGFAKVDLHRRVRCGFPEVIFGQGKTAAQIEAILRTLIEHEQGGLVTRVDPAAAAHLRSVFPAGRAQRGWPNLPDRGPGRARRQGGPGGDRHGRHERPARGRGGTGHRRGLELRRLAGGRRGRGRSAPAAAPASQAWTTPMRWWSSPAWKEPCPAWWGGWSIAR